MKITFENRLSNYKGGGFKTNSAIIGLILPILPCSIFLIVKSGVAVLHSYLTTYAATINIHIEKGLDFLTLVGVTRFIILNLSRIGDIS